MSKISVKLARTAVVGVWSIASMALAGQGKTSSACFEGSAQGKAVATAKTQEECQKLGEKFVWAEVPAAEHEHKAHKGKGKVKQQAKTEAKSEAKPETKVEGSTEAAPVTQPAVQPAPAAEPKK